MKNKNSRLRIPIATQLKLWVKAGGRCEFQGCNEDLLKDSLTLSETNYSDIAHIVAVSNDGPRGNDPLLAYQRNEINNLLLVCKKHHKLIDDKKFVGTYPVSKLSQFKKVHEERIYRLTSIHPSNKTTIVRFKSNIGKDVVHVPLEQIYQAVYPKYPVDETGIEIDLTTIKAVDSKSYWKVGVDCIKKHIDNLTASRINSQISDHVSVFAFGPIPFLVYLGGYLGNKKGVEIYQRHRDSEDWIWRRKRKITKYKLRSLKKGNNLANVSLVMSLSGQINVDDLPPKIRQNDYIYEITLSDQIPNPMFIKCRDDLTGFKEVYHQALSQIRKKHNKANELRLFPAVPVSIAVACGTERLPKVHPPLVVYDFNRDKSGFIKTLKVR